MVVEPTISSAAGRSCIMQKLQLMIVTPMKKT